MNVREAVASSFFLVSRFVSQKREGDSALAPPFLFFSRLRTPSGARQGTASFFPFIEQSSHGIGTTAAYVVFSFFLPTS